MTKVKKLTKRKNDITFYDTETMKPRCTFNQCIDKFTIVEYEDHSGYLSVFHKCNECGQKVQGKSDRAAGYKLRTLLDNDDPEEGAGPGCPL